MGSLHGPLPRKAVRDWHADYPGRILGPRTGRLALRRPLWHGDARWRARLQAELLHRPGIDRRLAAHGHGARARKSLSPRKAHSESGRGGRGRRQFAAPDPDPLPALDPRLETATDEAL